jgi:hypothetical protein
MDISGMGKSWQADDLRYLAAGSYAGKCGNPQLAIFCVEGRGYYTNTQQMLFPIALCSSFLTTSQQSFHALGIIETITLPWIRMRVGGMFK